MSASVRRVTKSSVDWKRFKQLLPEREHPNFTNFFAKNVQYVTRVASLPENLPKIDFEAYRKQLSNKGVVEKLEKGYQSFQVPYPKDVENVLGKINESEKESQNEMKQFLQSLNQKVEQLNLEKQKMQNLPPLEEMTNELVVYYYPNAVPAIEFGEDPHQQMLDDKKKAKLLGKPAGHH